ncbi:Transglutaminase-like superfamily protein [Caulifigura coniformis]|uniref:Transglutaminase-like superfamily protein n=2 Tax=Caulifigura coniformis TaxID=2527983 RepID=A0A517S8W6_9PLAN|nr:Transglutaminase-like superfamily protein [Caulifigura coniformis]
MLFHVSARLEYAVRFSSTLILNVHVQHNESQSIVTEQFGVEPVVPLEHFSVPGSDNRFVRLETGDAKSLTVSYAATVDCDHDILPTRNLEELPVGEIPPEVIPYLFPSRYCQSDKLARLAWDLFGKLPTPHDRVTGIVDWIHNNVEYLSGSTDSGTSAYDTVTQRTGVCRDFAHLGIALCRALNIPARYFTGYSYQLDPPDFHALFEAYLGGRWALFDATRLAPLNGLVRIGSGRDAADAAVATIFGGVSTRLSKVECKLGEGQNFTPLDRGDLTRAAVALETNTDATPEA